MKRELPKRNYDLEMVIRKRFSTFSAFCWVVGESPSVVSRILNGWQKISAKKKKKWARALKCDVRDIFNNG